MGERGAGKGLNYNQVKVSKLNSFEQSRKEMVGMRGTWRMRGKGERK